MRNFNFVYIKIDVYPVSQRTIIRISFYSRNEKDDSKWVRSAMALIVVAFGCGCFFVSWKRGGGQKKVEKFVRENIYGERKEKYGAYVRAFIKKINK